MKKYSGILKVAALLVLLPLVIWQFSFKKTYSLYKENKALEVQITTLDKKQTSSVEPVNQAISPFLSNGKILELIEPQAPEYGVKMVRFLPALINEDNTAKLYSGTLTLQGTFIGLVKMIGYVEKANLPVKISSLTFSYNPPKGKEADQLLLTILFQQIEN